METISPIRLLIVDDEQEFTASLAKVLTRRGIAVHVCENGSAALDYLARHHADVVLLDIKMPGMDGEEVFIHLQRRWPDLPVIVLTGHGDIPQAFRMSKHGVVDYLPKPCHVDELYDHVQQAARERKTAARSVLQPEPPDPPAANDGEDKPNVLLVDDEPELLAGLVNVLERRGLAVRTAVSGEDALAVLADTWIDVVVIDIKMPGMSGLELLKRIRSERPDVEVLMLTGHPRVDDASEAIKLGAAYFLTKPFDTAELVMRIESAFHRRRQTFRRRQEEAIRSVFDRGMVD